MFHFIGNVPNQLRTTYEALISRLEDAAEESDFGGIYGIANFGLTGQETYNVNAYLHLKDWKEKAIPSGRLQILVQAQETIWGPKPNYVLGKSTVRVSYFQIDQEQACLLHSVHFDHGPDMDRHPVFHAQITNETIPLGEYAVELGFEFPQVPCRPVHRNARIPTSDMTLPSTLLCLAADHIKPDLFRDLLDSVMDLQTRMPQPRFDRTRESIQATPAHLRSSHWFAHMRA